jgi:hypothetical protein
MPLLEVVHDHLLGAKVFFARSFARSKSFFGIRFFKGHWQLPLHPNSQKYFSILTDTGVYTPTRVLMGGCDSVAFCPEVVQEIFEHDLY